MTHLRNALLIVGTLFAAAPAHADFFESLYHSANILSTPSGSPLTQFFGGFTGGGQRSGRIRVVPNAAGNGHKLEFDRTFGADAGGRPEILDLGNFELELAGSISSDFSYTMRGIPTVTGSISASNLQYSIRGKSGFEDFEASGVFNLTQDVEITPLGFYTASIDLSNANSSLDFTGSAAEGDLDTDYNIGPIDVRGNIYFDAFVAALASFGVDTTQLEAIFPNSPIDRITEEIRTSLEKQASDLTNRIVAESSDPTAVLSAESGDVTFTSEDLESALVGPTPPSTVPEPGALALLAAGAVLVLRPRRE